MPIQNPITPRTGGTSSALNLTTATVIKATPGTVWRVVVNTAGSTVGGIYDTTTTGGAAAANLIFAIEAVGNFQLEWPCQNGIVFVPGTGMNAAVSYA